ncbi:MAG: electron transporter RnfG [Candidatus Neomarinimicrobiota bacterium]|nr:MAG: electron transporter RnfG [Candidatus Neomarinimicrobiota bacterium]RKY54045.1 MAG: electron transporter RnfG [Candidatus Neomarinimicrobiota bacterium]
MSNTARMIIVLTIAAILSGAILSVYNFYTYPKIQAHRQTELEKAIFEVIPDAEEYKKLELGEKVYYVGCTKKEKELGVAFLAEGNGFQGKISILVGMNMDMDTILAIKILEQVETPGLGTKIVDDPSNPEDRKWFTNQFKGLRALPEITYVKNEKPSKPGQIQAITGATISSRSVVEILNNAIKENREIFLKR